MKQKTVELAVVRRARRIAWGTWVVTVLATALGVALLLANRMTAVPISAIGYNGFWSFSALTFTSLAFASVGHCCIGETRERDRLAPLRHWNSRGRGVRRLSVRDLRPPDGSGITAAARAWRVAV